MNNTKTTKRALLSSVMAMLICVAMLIGTTFAWFTDSASTAVNKIQAGTLEIELQYATAWDAEWRTTAWADAEGRNAQFAERLLELPKRSYPWEPAVHTSFLSSLSIRAISLCSTRSCRHYWRCKAE